MANCPASRHIMSKKKKKKRTKPCLTLHVNTDELNARPQSCVPLLAYEQNIAIFSLNNAKICEQDDLRLNKI